jgi:hypothetical protein
MSAWHRRQIPPSRFQTCSRTYEGLLRSRHSCTQASLQNVRRRDAVIGSRHQRQIGRPSPSRSGFPHRSRATARRRMVLTRDLIERANAQLQNSPTPENR